MKAFLALLVNGSGSLMYCGRSPASMQTQIYLIACPWSLLSDFGLSKIAPAGSTVDDTYKVRFHAGLGWSWGGLCKSMRASVGQGDG